jgi:hypothetical protein
LADHHWPPVVHSAVSSSAVRNNSISIELLCLCFCGARLAAHHCGFCNCSIGFLLYTGQIASASSFYSGLRHHSHVRSLRDISEAELKKKTSTEKGSRPCPNTDSFLWYFTTLRCVGSIYIYMFPQRHLLNTGCLNLCSAFLHAFSRCAKLYLSIRVFFAPLALLGFHFLTAFSLFARGRPLSTPSCFAF